MVLCSTWPSITAVEMRIFRAGAGTGAVAAAGGPPASVCAKASADTKSRNENSTPNRNIQPPTSKWPILTAALAHLQHSQESFLRNVHAPNPLHPLLAFLLFLQQLTLTGNVAAVALGDDILADRRNRLARNDLRSNRRLYRHFKHLPRDQLSHLAHQQPPAIVSEVFMDDRGQRIHWFARNHDIELRHRRRPVARQVIIKRCVAPGNRFKPVVKIEHDFI